MLFFAPETRATEKLPPSYPRRDPTTYFYLGGGRRDSYVRLVGKPQNNQRSRIYLLKSHAKLVAVVPGDIRDGIEAR